VDDDRLTVSVQRYDPRRGAVADVEGGTIRVSLDGGGVYILGDAAGLRDLARWCLALTDPDAKRGSHVHLDPNVTPLAVDSLPLLIAIEPSEGA